MLEPGRNCWRIERADRAALVVDACDYFKLARQAMLRAKSQIMLIGWDFDTRIFLDEEERDGAPGELGPFLSWLAKHRPEVKINILRWNLGAVKLLGRGTTIFRLAQWAASKQITFKLDAAHPFAASHHQKIVVIDDRLAFCGGIDMTATRWDTSEHRTDDPRRKRPTTGRLYGPWHDATMAVDGAAAKALGDLARERWEIAGGGKLPVPDVESDPWPAELEPHFAGVDIAVARTRGSIKDVEPLREIEELYLDMIKRARRFVYAENQFFASRTIAAAIAERLKEPDGPEFVIVTPNVVEGLVEEEVMSPARAELMRRLAEVDVHKRFRIYTPVTSDGEDIYVHAKITIVDDEMLRVGSANINNRSMGLDSECDLLLDVKAGNDGVEDEIGFLRCRLLAEHLGVPGEVVKENFAQRGLIGTIEALRGKGRTLVPFEPKEPNDLEKALVQKELLDPESAGEDDDPAPRPGLLRGIGRRFRHRHPHP
ncbi:phospholipase D-like domain-containing protein [Sphingosinicella sp. BN140058]|uniref:phospholipase D-like domain-containing protein n=1 Tax=Sphingosinicella sp. BN140058 TaxID=1892855 RepID=UPI001FB190CC|nr:phospholipase D-like domain-containing protein [Sphingosinicella sp. BN140058]